MLTGTIRGVSIRMAVITGCEGISDVNADFSSKEDSLIVCQKVRNADPTLFGDVSGGDVAWKDYGIGKGGATHKAISGGDAAIAVTGRDQIDKCAMCCTRYRISEW